MILDRREKEESIRQSSYNHRHWAYPGFLRTLHYGLELPIRSENHTMRINLEVKTCSKCLLKAGSPQCLLSIKRKFESEL